MNDAKDVFHYDENWDYITNRPKEPIRIVEAPQVHEEFELDKTNNYGEFCKLVQDLKKNLKAELKKDEPDTDSIVNEFNTQVSTLVNENPDMFAGPKSSPPTGLIEYPFNDNPSGGPIPGVIYDPKSEDEISGSGGGITDDGTEF